MVAWVQPKQYDRWSPQLGSRLDKAVSRRDEKIAEQKAEAAKAKKKASDSVKKQQKKDGTILTAPNPVLSPMPTQYPPSDIRSRPHGGKETPAPLPRAIEGPPPNRIAMTQHAEPLGQMSLFPVPSQDERLYKALEDRSVRSANHPPAMAPGRQVEKWAARTSLPKKPGSQGTLAQPARFKTAP
jgi:hypothetical protein